jgi:preprotein translocase subunit SecG
MESVVLLISITILSILEALCAILLMAIILLQKSRSHGAAAGLAFGAGMGESLFGSQATTVLTKATVILTTFFLVVATLLAVLGSRVRGTGGVRSVTDGLPSAPPAEAGAPMSGGPGAAPMVPGGDMAAPAPMATPVQSAPLLDSGAAQPVKVESPAPAPAPAPAPQNNTGDKPAQPQ